jgi:hypothetical protein
MLGADPIEAASAALKKTVIRLPAVARARAANVRGQLHRR